MTRGNSRKQTDWQLEHYASVGKDYGDKHFTSPDSAYTEWILERIASVKPDAARLAEVGAGTCVFSSLLAERMRLETDVVCFEPVEELLEAAAEFANVQPNHGDAVDFARNPLDDTFDLVFSKDAAHHFPVDTLDEVHEGICRNLRRGGRYLMVVRTPPREPSVPVGSIARARWERVYTPLAELLASMRRVDDWREVEVTRWQLEVETSVDAWMQGIESRDSWSIFSALDDEEIEATLEELTKRFHGTSSFDFLHQYDITIFEKDSEDAKAPTGAA